jgi:hypothetical protein
MTDSFCEFSQTDNGHQTTRPKQLYQTHSKYPMWSYQDILREHAVQKHIQNELQRTGDPALIIPYYNLNKPSF